MQVNNDYRDLFSIFNEETVEYLVVGAHAVMFYSTPRYTKDLDVWVNPSADNASRVWSALQRFGAPLKDIAVNDFTDPELVYQIGVAPNRIDIIMGLEGVDFPSAWRNAVPSTYGEVPIRVISRTDLITAKRATARDQDLLDLKGLEHEGSEPA